MAIQTIEYATKVTLNENADVADINKGRAADWNEIKSVVNNNASELSNATEKNYIHATLSENQISSNSYTAIKYNPVIQQGDGMTLSNGVITINSDNISQLLITLSLRTSDWNATTIYYKILKNNEEYMTTLQSTSNPRLTEIVEVEKDDIIEIQVYCNQQKTFEANITIYNYMNILGIY